MTNQEPGAPEPLTSEEERAFRAEIAALKRPDYDSFKGRVGRLLATLDRDRAALTHPESDTRVGDPCAAAAVGLPHEHVTESDTRGLDVAREAMERVKAVAIEEGGRLTPGAILDIQAAINALTVASPDLSIDREADPGSSFPHRGSWRHAVWCPTVIAQVGDVGCSCGLDEVRRLAIRGTSQPEPTE